MKMFPTPRALAEYLDKELECSCGKTHYAPLKKVIIEENALAKLPEVIREMGYEHIFMVADSITYDLAGKACEELLRAAGIDFTTNVLHHTGFDEATVGELLINMPARCDLCVAIGTGSINDMTRFFSHRMGRPFMTVATAAPMDGFASGIAAIYANNMKTTFEAQTPVAIFGDTSILKNAPYGMIAAGLGDLLGKFTCLNDWKLARVITGEHYCEEIVELVESCAKDVLANASRAKDRDPQICGDIMEGLVLSGVAMSLYGNSRSASGSEHHMSHFWEMIFEQQGKRPVPHGTQVGVGTVMILKLAELLKKYPVDFDRARTLAAEYDPAEWEKTMHSVYGPAADSIIEVEHASQKNATSARLTRIDTMQQHWTEIVSLLEKLPSSEEVIELLRSLDSPCFPSEIGIDQDLMRDTFLYCKEVRPRYTILQLCWDLGILSELADQLVTLP